MALPVLLGASGWDISVQSEVCQQGAVVLTLSDRCEPAHRHSIQAQGIAGCGVGAAGRLCCC